MSDSPTLTADLDLARAAVLAAGEVVIPYFHTALDVRFKSADQPVTVADLAADRGEPVNLPLTNETIAAIADLKARYRAGDNPAMQK